MSPSPWFECSLGNLRIGYNVTVTTPAGVELDRPNMPRPWPWPAPIGGKDELILRPKGDIKFSAYLKFESANPQIRGEFEAGFLQTQISCQRDARYGAMLKPIAFTFSRAPGCPVKDGDGDPWYQEDKGGAIVKISSLPLAKRSITSSVSVWDRPKFGFPPLVGTTPLESVVCDDHFVTCLAIISRDGASKRINGLYRVEWRYQCSLTRMGQPTGTVLVLSSGPAPPPYLVPPNMKLSGPSANRSEKTSLRDHVQNRVTFLQG